MSKINFIWLLIVGLLFFPIITISNNIGLYYDAIMPDYKALQLLNANIGVKDFFWQPFIAQIYHGYVSFYITLLITAIIGSTSILSHYLMNASIIIVCVYTLAHILKKLQINSSVLYSSLIVFVCMPSIIIFCITQYFIELPGIFFLLLSFNFYINYQDSNSTEKKIKYMYLMYIFLGLASYTYFNFLFFAFGFFIINLREKNNLKEKIYSSLIAYSGMLYGISLYIAGYIMIYCYNTKMSHIAFFAGFTVLCIVNILNIMLYRELKKNKFKTSYLLFGITITIVCSVLVLSWPYLYAIAQNLNFQGNSISFINRIKYLYSHIYDAVSGKSGEQLIYHDVLIKYQVVYFIIFIVLTIIDIFIVDKNKKVIDCLLILGVYVFCLFFLASRIHAQHCVPIVFWIALIMIMEINDIYNSFGKKHFIKYMFVFMGVCLFILNIINRFNFVNQAIFSNKSTFYSTAINKLSYDAIENYYNGKKELYLFPEWGLRASFIYLTQNRISSSTNISENFISEVASTYDYILLSYFEKENRDKYYNLLKKMSTYIEEDCYKEKNNNMFYVIKISNSQPISKNSKLNIQPLNR